MWQIVLLYRTTQSTPYNDRMIIISDKRQVNNTVLTVCMSHYRCKLYEKLKSSQLLTFKVSNHCLSTLHSSIHIYIYCRSGNIRKVLIYVLIFENFARRTNSRIKESSENIILYMYYYHNRAIIIEIDNSRIQNFAKSPAITNSRKSKHARITRSTYIFLW